MKARSRPPTQPTSSTEFVPEASGQVLAGPTLDRQRERDAFIVSSSVRMRPDVLVEERPATPSGVAASGVTTGDRLPRDVLVRLAALSRRVGAIRQENGANTDVSTGLDSVIAGLDSLIQRIYDETARYSAD